MRRLLLLLFFIPSFAFAQGNDSTILKKISVGLVFSPDYCYRILKSDDAGKFIVNMRDTFETAKFGFSAGLKLSIKINKRFYIETGLLFSDKGEKTKKYPLTYGEMIDPRYGFIYQTNSGNNPENNVFNYHYYFLDVPIKVNYNLLNKKFKIYFSAGIMPELYITNKTTLVLEYSDGSKQRNHSKDNVTTFNTFSVSILAGVGVSYDLRKRWNLTFQPEYRQALTPLNENSIQQYLYSYGVNTGIAYQL